MRMKICLKKQKINDRINKYNLQLMASYAYSI